MNGKRFFAVLKDCLRRYRWLLVLTFVNTLGTLLVFYLYETDMEPVLYTSALSVAAVLAFVCIAFLRAYRRAEERERILNSVAVGWDCLPAARSMAENDYQQMIRTLGRKIRTLEADFEHEKQDMQDYYTAWVHQIKTPIAVMRMLLAEEDSEQNRAVSAELFRIEEYVDMVLQYIRLGSDTNDFVIRTYELDELLRACIRKYASRFIAGRLQLQFEPTGLQTVTDKKWFSVIIEQLLSNAVKYTPPGGTIRIFSDKDGSVSVSDTGIGIAQEDIPRIFEKGYTGHNGRAEQQKASGLGLYLCRQAADKLCLQLSVTSVPGRGSTFTVTEKNKTDS